MAAKLKKLLKTIFKYSVLCIIILVFSACSSVKPLKLAIPKELPQAKPIEKVKVALVLGAGGARSLVHLGVLEVLEENHIPIDLIVGSSAGSLIGALYADYPNAKYLKHRLLPLKKDKLIDYSYLDFMQGSVKLKGAVRGNLLQKFLYEELVARDFKDLKIPLVAVTTETKNNQLFAINSGPIIPAVHASSALPPIFTPVELYGNTLVDGGVISPVPVEVAKTYDPDIIIAVDISTPPVKHTPKNMLDLTYRALHISYYALAAKQREQADFYIHPDLTGIGVFEDGKNYELYQMGREAAEAMVGDIRAMLDSKEKQSLNLVQK